jgi:hypothetical protein
MSLRSGAVRTVRIYICTTFQHPWIIFGRRQQARVAGKGLCPEPMRGQEPTMRRTKYSTKLTTTPRHVCGFASAQIPRSNPSFWIKWISVPQGHHAVPFPLIAPGAPSRYFRLVGQEARKVGPQVDCRRGKVYFLRSPPSPVRLYGGEAFSQVGRLESLPCKRRTHRTSDGNLQGQDGRPPKRTG